MQLEEIFEQINKSVTQDSHQDDSISLKEIPTALILILNPCFTLKIKER